MAAIRSRNTTALAVVSTVTDSNAGDHWVRATGVTQGNNADGEIWYVAGAASLTTSQSVTVTVGGTSAPTSAIAFTVLDVTGAASTSPLDRAAAAGGNSATATSGTTATTVQANEIAVGDVGWNTTGVTPSQQTAGYTTTAVEQATISGSAAAEQAAWQVLTATGAQSYGATLSSSQTWTGAIATFKVGTPATPTITSFSPTSGVVGTPVTITGSGYAGTSGAGGVQFNGTNATYTVTDDSHISTSVPTGATTGPIKVAAPGGNVTSSTSFTVNPPPTPTITGFSPTSGSVGTPVTITGSGYTGTTGSNGVQFNGTSATYSVTDDSHISTSVPTGATTGKIKVTAPGGNVTSTATFTVSVGATQPHVLLVVEENQGISNIIGNTSAPYINNLATTYASATNWYSVQGNSPNDYLELLSGSNQGYPIAQGSSSATTLVDELHTKGIPWQGYMENMSSTPPTCFKGTDSTGLYSTIHNPFRYFANYTTNSGGWCSGATPLEGVQPYPSGGVAPALSGANAPDFVWITPNDCNDMHGQVSACNSSSNNQLIAAGDTWLSNNIGPVISSPWFAQNGIIIITWDEGGGGTCCGGGATGGHIATIVVTSKNKGLGNFIGTGDHYGTLAAIEKAYGVPTLLGGSSNPINGDLTGAFVNAATGSISGTVTDTQVPAQPVSGATVCIHLGSGVCGGGDSTTTTNSSGVYNFATVSPGSYTVSVTATGFTPPATQPATVTAGTTATVNFTMTATGGISGAVFDSQTPTAKPINGASVHYAGTGSTTGSGTTSSSPTGAYSFTGVPPGTYSVTATATGFTPPAADPVTVTAGNTATANFTMTATSGISGTVSDSQAPAKPINGATVSYSGGSATATTNSSGAYTLSGVPAGSYTVSVAATGFTPPATQPVTVTAGNTTSGVNFTMTATTGISGTVFDTQAPAQPVTGATISYSGTAGSGSTNVINSTTGAYTLSGVPAGTYTVSVAAPGFTTPSSQPVTVATSGDTPPSVNFTMAATTGISGTVFDTQAPAQAVNGATVTYTGTGSSTGSGTTTTNSSGAYSFTGVPPGTYSVAASDTPAGFTTPPAQPVTVATSGNTPPSVNFTMAATSGIIGGVSDAATTAGIPNATVQYLATGTSSGSGSTTTATGCVVTSPCPYTLNGVPAGTYNVTASAPGYATSLPKAVTVPVGGNATANFTLAASTTGSISGTVSDSQTPAHPISGAIVCYYSGSSCGNTDPTTTTNASGAYNFASVPPGPYNVTVTATGFTAPAADPVTVTTGGNQTANLTMTATSGISGTVFDTQSPAQPVTGATVSYSGTTGSGSTNVINSSTGSYTLSGVPAGSYTVSVTAPGFTSPSSQPVTVATSGNTPPSVNFTMTATSGISGAVSDSQTPSQPVNNVTVSYVATGSSTGTGSTTSGPTGAYSFAGVPPGTYNVTVTAPTGFTVTTTNPVGVTVTAGNTQTANFTLTATTAISGTVFDTQTPAQPVTGATVSYVGSGTTHGSGSTNVINSSTGSYTLNGVPAGTYTVSVTAPGFTTPSSQPVTVATSGDTPPSVNFTMSATSGISGAVSDSQTPAQPVNNVTVSYAATGASTGSGTTTSGPTGAYSFAGVPPGTYNVTVTVPTGYTATTTNPVAVTVTSGNSATANFTLTATSGISGTVTDSSTHVAITTATVSYVGTGGTTGSGSTTAINSTTGAYTLSGVPAGTYTVTASAAGYGSQSLTGVVVTAGNTTPNENFTLTSSHQPIFSDGFESGNFSAWTKIAALTIQTTHVHTGTYGAEGNVNNAPGYAQKTLPSTYTSGYTRIWFNIVSQTSQINVLRVRTAAGSPLLWVLVDAGTHDLGLSVLGSRVATSTTPVIPGSGWHELEAYAAINGASPSVEVWLDGIQVNSLTWSGSLGSTPIGGIQIGEASGQTWDVAFDDVAFDTQFLP